MLLTAIIVNYNVKHYLHQCLESLRRAAKGMEWEVYVVDNNSADGSIEYLNTVYPEGSFPELHIIANDNNPGFGRANNQAFAISEGKYVLYVNPDTFVSENALRDCVEFMDNHPDAGCLGVKMLNANGTFAMESRRGVPTPWASFCKVSRLGKLFPNSEKFGRYYLQHLPIDKPAKIEIVSGAFMMVNREIVSQVGVFDDDYFMYCEDTDLAYRMIKAGYHNYYLPTTILHYKGESTRRYSYSFVNIFYKAILIFFRKHFNNHFFVLRILIYIALYALGALSFIRGITFKGLYKIRTAIAPRKIRFFVLTDKQNTDNIDSLFATKTNVEYKMCADVAMSTQGIQEQIAEYSPDYLVYDTEKYSYGQILSLAYNMPIKYSIGTYYPKQQMLLTNLFIFKK